MGKTRDLGEIITNAVIITTNQSINGIKKFIGNVVSTSTVTGTVIVEGGVGVSGSIYAGNLIFALGGNSTNWNTAFSWGNHAGLYSLSTHTHAYLPLAGGTLTGEIINNFDGLGITLQGGGRFYKKSGTGMVVRQSNGGQRLQEENNSGVILGTYAYTSELANGNTAFGWGNHSGLYRPISYVPTFSEITAKPTTIAGFGITDYNSLGDARWSLSSHTHTFASLTARPTTLAGYGITDTPWTGYLPLTGGVLSGALQVNSHIIATTARVDRIHMKSNESNVDISAAIAISKNITMSTAHIIEDNSTITPPSGSAGYGMVDMSTIISGTFATDHVHAFQSRLRYISSANMGTHNFSSVTSFYSENQITGTGIVDKVIGFKAVDTFMPNAGKITKQYGLLIENLTTGVTNYGMWVDTRGNYVKALSIGATTIDATNALNVTGTSYFSSTVSANGFSGGWGATNGVNTGAFNAVSPTNNSSAFWLLSGNTAGVFKYGIQGLDIGGQLRFWEGANSITFTNNTLFASAFSGAGTGLTGTAGSLNVGQLNSKAGTYYKQQVSVASAAGQGNRWLRIAKTDASETGSFHCKVDITNTYNYNGTSPISLYFSGSYRGAGQVVQTGGSSYVISQARVVFPTTADTDYYIEVFLQQTNLDTLTITLSDFYNVSLLNTPITGSIPANHSSKSILTNYSAMTAESIFATSFSGAGTGLIGNALGLGIGGNVTRQTHSSGYLIGSYNIAGDNASKTNPIYTIGSSYMPTDTSLVNMYGIGFANEQLWGSNKGTGWGMYTAEAGVIVNTLNYSGLWTRGKVQASAIGGFSCSNFTPNGRTSIYYLGDAPVYGLSYFQGTAGLVSGVDTIGFHFGDATAAGSQFAFQQNGNLRATGAITATAFFGPSDMRLKNVVEDVQFAEFIPAMAYTWKDKSKGEKVQVGYSAQEVQKYMPNAVDEDSKGMLSVNYTQVLVAKIAMLEKQIKILQDAN